MHFLTNNIWSLKDENELLLKIIRCQFIKLRVYNQNFSYYKSSYKDRLCKKNQLKLSSFSHQTI